MSKYLKDSKQSIRKLIDILSKDFSYVSVLGTDCTGKNYRAYKNGNSINSSSWNERGFVVRVHNGINISEFSFNEINEDKIYDIADNIKKDIEGYLKICKLMPVNNYDQIVEEEITKSSIEEVEIDPKNVKEEEIIKRLISIKDKGLKKSNFVVDFYAVYNYLHVNKIFISNKKDLEQSYLWSEAYLICIASKDGNSKDNFKSFSGLKGVELLDEMEQYIDETVDRTLKALEAEPIKPGEYDVICSPDVSGLIAHEAFGHGVEMDMFVKNRAKAKEYVGKYVASPLVTMRDGAASAREVSSFAFDDEGILAKDTVIIDKGILKSGICDSISAMALGVKPTGNGKRQSFERKAYTRMTNTFFEPGHDKLENMISSIEYGFLLDSSSSGMEDPKNWGIQCMVSFAYEIKDGKLTGKVYSPVILTGYVPDLLKSISMVSEDIKLSGSGACGKGYKELSKVSCGGPYIKAKVRLG